MDPPRTDRTQRLVALDVVRAVALFGVLAVNVDTQFAVSPFERFVAPAAPVLGGWDRVARAVITSGFEERPLIVFSFLFGMGLATQHRAAPRDGGGFVAMVVRRLGFLLVLGVLHFVLAWVGDVLALYALVGFVALPLVALPRRALVAIALSFLVLSVLSLPLPAPFATADELRAHVEAAREIYAHGSYATIVAFRVHEARPALAILLWSIPRTIGLFALGASVDATWLRDVNRRALAGWAGAALATGFLVQSTVAERLRGVARTAAFDWSEIAIALGAAALAFVAADAAKDRLAALAALGRMTLTSYLCESVVLGFVFYGYGMGLFDRVGHAAGLALAAALFATQTVFAVLWLRRFPLGPVEWVWRSFARSRTRPGPPFQPGDA